MIEMLAGLLILAAATLLAVHRYSSADLEHYYFMHRYLLLQSECLKNRESQYFEEGISFNSMGHVNQGRTVSIGKHKVIVHLGNGYLSYE